MADSPERESKRRRLLEPSSVSDSPAPFQPDAAFLETTECLEGSNTYSNDPGDLSLYDPGNEDEDALSSDAVASFEPCAALHEIIDCREDSGTQVDEASNSISYDIDGGHGIVCFGTVSIRWVHAPHR